MQMNLFPEDEEARKRSLVYGTPEFRAKYSQALKSTHWRKLGLEVANRAGKRCEAVHRGERCPNTPKKLQVHHLHYRTLGNETLADVIGLCAGCHEIADRRRERENQDAYEAAGEAARLDNWKASFFKTKYGEDADEHIMADPEGTDREFENWREKKEREREEMGEAYYRDDY